MTTASSSLVPRKLLYVVLYCACTLSATAQTSVQERLQELEVFYRVYDTIQAHYADEKATASRQLINSALRGMAGGLDAYSQYFDPETYAQVRAEARGELAGVGITLSAADSGVRIVAVLPGSPAENAGVRVGERVLRVDRRSVAQMFISEVVQMLRGPQDTEVELDLMDELTGETRNVRIRRAFFRVPSIGAARLLEGDIKVGYIRVGFFNDDAGREFQRTLQRLMEQEIRGLVLDLRGNPGGSLDSAIAMASHFLNKDDVVTRLSYRGGKVEDLRAKSATPAFDGPLAVLINSGTASAAEMLAAALREHRRAVLVGERSFGKGSLQNFFDLPDGSGLRLTTAFYLTPSGDRIEAAGLSPDITIVQSPAQVTALRAAELGSSRANQEANLVDEPLLRAADALRAVITYRSRKGT